MEARHISAVLVAVALLSMGASHRTQNFIVTASTPQLAREICEKAECDRRSLAVEWLGSELPPWPEPCPITAQVAPNPGAGGATSFMFNARQPFGWSMSIQGSRERILDSVVPHEVTHTIFATHFGRPLPRWADEGACTTVEGESERRKQEKMLIEFLTTNRGIAFNRMFAMKEYPRDVLPLYSQGYSLARYLIAQGGKRKYVDYVGEGMKTNNWSYTTNKFYGIKDLSELQVTWLDWVRKGSPPINVPELTGDPNVMLASNDRSRSRNVPAAVDPSNKTAAVVPVKEPPINQLASVEKRRSWYLEQRDRPTSVSSLESPGDVSTSLASNEGGYSPGSIRSQAESSTMLSRPQPVGRPQQTVLEWKHETTPAVNRSFQAVPRPRVISAPQVIPYYNTSILPLSTGSS